jgi:para-nitrobenzyl esterase
MMVEPSRFIATEAAAAGQPAWQYRFSYVATSLRDKWITGAPHATEIPYVFDTVKARYGADLTADDAATAHAANMYWVSFVKTGDPNTSGLPNWPKYGAGTDIILDFTPAGPAAVADPWKTRLDLTQTLATAKH